MAGYAGITTTAIGRFTGRKPRHVTLDEDNSTTSPPHYKARHVMYVLWWDFGSGSAALAKEIISKFRNHPKLENTRKGGEGCREEEPMCVYWCENTLPPHAELMKEHQQELIACRTLKNNARTRQAATRADGEAKRRLTFCT